MLSAADRDVEPEVARPADARGPCRRRSHMWVLRRRVRSRGGVAVPRPREEVPRVTLRPSIHWLLIAMPVAAALDAAGVAAPLVFLCAALAIVPLAGLIVHSTEHLATHTGPALGGLLNATFGNLPELIIAMVALRAGLVEMVRASLIGALLANLLLALGVAFLLGGLRYHAQDYNPGAARVYAVHDAPGGRQHGGAEHVPPLPGGRRATACRRADMGVAVVLLVAYFSTRLHAPHPRGGLRGDPGGIGPRRRGSAVLRAQTGTLCCGLGGGRVDERGSGGGGGGDRSRPRDDAPVHRDRVAGRRGWRGRERCGDRHGQEEPDGPLGGHRAWAAPSRSRSSSPRCWCCRAG